MANIVRTYTAANIIQGPVDVYINIAAPPSSALPTADVNTLTLDANGQPTSGTGFHVGSVEGPTTITLTEKSNLIMDDQHETGIDVAFDTIDAEIDFNMKELNLSRLFTVLSSAALGNYTALANQQALQIGGQLSSATTVVTLLLVTPNRTNTAKFLYWFMYKSFLKSPIPYSFHRTKENVHKVKFGAVMDFTRVAGDELMQMVKQK